MQDRVDCLLRQLLDRIGERELEALRESLEDRHAVLRRAARLLPRQHRAVPEREVGVREDELGVGLELGAEAGARGTRAVRRVEGEAPRLDLADREIAFGAREPLAEEALRCLGVSVSGDDESLTEPQGRLDGVGETRTIRLGVLPMTHDEPIDDDLERVLLHLVERDVLGEVADETVDAHARESAATRGHEQLLVFALAVAHERREDEQSRPLGIRRDLIDDLLDRLRDDRDAVVGAVRHTDAREQQTQVVVDLSDRADRRPRVARGALLVDRHGGRESFDEVDVRFLHLTQELPRVGGEGLDVPSLTLRVDRVERERRLPRSREARDDDELVSRDLDVDVLEVVLPRALYMDRAQRHQWTAPEMSRRCRCSVVTDPAPATMRPRSWPPASEARAGRATGRGARSAASRSHRKAIRPLPAGMCRAAR